LAREQDTVWRELPYEPGGFGVGWTVHLVPFHRSARVLMILEEFSYTPTAVQRLFDEQATPERSLFSVGFGVVWTVQVVPFHRSASVL
jgi:hypothetical protein